MRLDLLIMGETINQMSTEKTIIQKVQLWMSRRDLPYEFGQISLSEGTSRHCKIALTGEHMKGYNRYKRRFYGQIFGQSSGKKLIKN